MLSERKTIVRIIGVALVLVFLAWAVFNFSTVRQYLGTFMGFFSSFTVGLVIAFIINLPMVFIEKRLFLKPWKRGEKFRSIVRRGLAIVISFLIIVGILVGLGFLVIPEIIQMFGKLSERIPETIREVSDWVAAKKNEGGTLAPFFERAEEWLTESSKNAFVGLQNKVLEIAQTALQYVRSLASAVFSFVVSLIFAIYVLIKKEALGGQLKQIMYALLPERFVDSLVSVGSLASSIFSRFAAGQALEAVILGLMFSITMLILRLPYAAMIGALTMVTALIPIYGAIITAVLGAFLLFVESPAQALIFIIMAIVLQQLEGDIIYPHVVGNAVGLPSIWTFVAVTLGGSIGGLVGMMIAVPCASLIYLLFSAFVRKRLDHRNVSPLKFGFHLFDPTETEGESELARRRRLARIAVGAETVEERSHREETAMQLHAELGRSKWKERLEQRYQHFKAALEHKEKRRPKPPVPPEDEDDTQNKS